MSKLFYILIVLFCLAVWALVVFSFATGLSEMTGGNMLRVIAGGWLTNLMLRKAGASYRLGKLL